MTKPKTPNARSPYQKYEKQPYKYDFPGCSHQSTTLQSVAGWRGKICTRCNTILDGPFDTDNSRSYAR
jgi:hypothetical protein